MKPELLAECNANILYKLFVVSSEICMEGPLEHPLFNGFANQMTRGGLS